MERSLPSYQENSALHTGQMIIDNIVHSTYTPPPPPIPIFSPVFDDVDMGVADDPVGREGVVLLAPVVNPRAAWT